MMRCMSRVGPVIIRWEHCRQAFGCLQHTGKWFYERLQTPVVWPFDSQINLRYKAGWRSAWFVSMTWKQNWASICFLLCPIKLSSALRPICPRPYGTPQLYPLGWGARVSRKEIHPRVLGPCSAWVWPNPLVDGAVTPPRTHQGVAITTGIEAVRVCSSLGSQPSLSRTKKPLTV